MPDAGREPTPEPSEGLGDVLEEFARTLTGNIVGSLLRNMPGPGVEVMASGFAPPWETLAEDLVSAAVEVALLEVSGTEGRSQRSGSDSSKMDGVPDNPTSQSGRIRASLDTDQSNRTQIPDDSQCQNSPLSQLGLPTVGSLDYPDAPPTTPLFPVFERSRSSFDRKLKGGLAKVFLPSPPPPTPMDEEEGGTGAKLDPRMELMEHLMHSLTTWDPYEEGTHGGAKMEALAEALSCDIIDKVLKTCEQRAEYPTIDVDSLAHRLAKSIVASSLDEARMLV